MRVAQAYLDEHSERALTLSALLDREDRALRLISYTGGNADLGEDDIGDIRAQLRSANAEIRWLVESRARWMLACRTQQITIHEEVHP